MDFKDQLKQLGDRVTKPDATRPFIKQQSRFLSGTTV